MEYKIWLVVLGVVLLLPATTSANTISTNASVRDQVLEVFADAPEMIAIAECESKFRQFADSGAPLYGGWNRGMVGVFQFYENIHGGDALRLGYDLATVEGNIGYAHHLYNLQGLRPWASSEFCWTGKVEQYKNLVTEIKSKADKELTVKQKETNKTEVKKAKNSKKVLEEKVDIKQGGEVKVSSEMTAVERQELLEKIAGLTKILAALQELLRERVV